MPRAVELPNTIKSFSRRNGRDVSNARFNPDCLELINTLEQVLKEKPTSTPAPAVRAMDGLSYQEAVIEAVRRVWSRMNDGLKLDRPVAMLDSSAMVIRLDGREDAGHLITVVVLPPTNGVVLAAAEFSDFLEVATGAQVPVAIVADTPQPGGSNDVMKRHAENIQRPIHQMLWRNPYDDYILHIEFQYLVNAYAYGPVEKWPSAAYSMIFKRLRNGRITHWQPRDSRTRQQRP